MHNGNCRFAQQVDCLGRYADVPAQHHLADILQANLCSFLVSFLDDELLPSLADACALLLHIKRLRVVAAWV